MILGVSYKAGVGDMRESPAVKIIEGLQSLGAEVSFHDPHVAELPELGLESVDLAPAVAAADLVCVVTAHDGIDYDDLVARAARVLDFRGITHGTDARNLAWL